VLSFWRGQGRLRPWIATVAAYALALQALLGSVIVAQAANNPDAFVICTASDDGSAVGHGGTQQRVHENCALCTLAKNAHAILADDHTALPAPVAYTAIRLAQATARIAAYRSPTGQYQRGPPVHFSAA
jgi:DUF2946 family protein